MDRKVLFVHDGPVYRNRNGDYFGIHYDNKLIQRYLHLGKEIIFLMRVVAISDDNLKNYSKLTSNSFRVIEIPNIKSIRLFIKYYKIARSIIEKAVDESDIIICRIPSISSAIALRRGGKVGKPVLVECVACTFDAYWNHSFQGKLIAHFKMWQQKRLIKHAPYTIYVTSSFLQSRYPSLGNFIGCSDVEIGFLAYNVLNNRINRIKGSNYPLVLGTIAALDVAYKGQADVIRAIAGLMKNGIQFSYRLVGQGDSTRLRRLISKLKVNHLVTIEGAIMHHEIFNFLDSIDVYIQPSKLEGLPRAVVEAMSRACPIIGSNVGGIPELVDKKMVFRAGDINGIKKKLIGLTKELLLEQSRINFERSKDYESNQLEMRRLEFFTRFLYEHGFVNCQ